MVRQGIESPILAQVKYLDPLSAVTVSWELPPQLVPAAVDNRKFVILAALRSWLLAAVSVESCLMLFAALIQGLRLLLLSAVSRGSHLLLLAAVSRGSHLLLLAVVSRMCPFLLLAAASGSHRWTSLATPLANQEFPLSSPPVAAIRITSRLLR